MQKCLSLAGQEFSEVVVSAGQHQETSSEWCNRDRLDFSTSVSDNPWYSGQRHNQWNVCTVGSLQQLCSGKRSRFLNLSGWIPVAIGDDGLLLLQNCVHHKTQSKFHDISIVKSFTLFYLQAKTNVGHVSLSTEWAIKSDILFWAITPFFSECCTFCTSKTGKMLDVYNINDNKAVGAYNEK